MRNLCVTFSDFGSELLLLLSCLLICVGVVSFCDFLFVCCFSVRITAVIAGLYRRVVLKKSGKVRAVQ